MTVKELMKCLEGIDENLQVFIPCENAYVAINHVTLSLLRREHDDEYLRAVALSYNADKGEQKKKPKAEEGRGKEMKSMIIRDACMYYRHDFGLMQEEEQKATLFEAREWLYAWSKALADAGDNRLSEMFNDLYGEAMSCDSYIVQNTATPTIITMKHKTCTSQP